MKKMKLFVPVTLSALLLVGCGTQEATQDRNEVVAVPMMKTGIVLDAGSAAVAHAGVMESDVVFEKIEIDLEAGRQVYEVEFQSSDHVEYDVEVDAVTGEVLTMEIDKEDSMEPEREEKVKKHFVSESENKTEIITKDEAKNIALAQVPGAVSTDIWEFEVDFDDHSVVYEGTIVYNEMEYEFEINGKGEITEWDVESVYD